MIRKTTSIIYKNNIKTFLYAEKYRNLEYTLLYFLTS